MSIAKRPSKITLPQNSVGWETLLDFLVHRFPLINKAIWIERFQQNKIHWLDGEIINIGTAYTANKTLCYYREVVEEPKVPFNHEIIFQNEHILVACKPHFLPVTPGGRYVNECLLERIRQQMELPELVPLHRLDRETAGLVMFSLNTNTRGIYSQLFAQHKIMKQYQAVAFISSQEQKVTQNKRWSIENRLVKSNPSFLMEETEGETNAISEIKLLKTQDDLGLFQLKAITGKTHQLRLHMMKIGMPILNDSFYPILQEEKKLTFIDPLQLLAKRLAFVDPINGQEYEFESKRQLKLS